MSEDKGRDDGRACKGRLATPGADVPKEGRASGRGKEAKSE